MKLLFFYCPLQEHKPKEILAQKVIPQNMEIKTIALPCLAKLEVIHLLKALEAGAEGVAIWGCADEDCLYPPGSIIAKGRVKYAQKILQDIGLEKFRFQYFGGRESNCRERIIEFGNWLKEILPAEYLNF